MKVDEAWPYGAQLKNPVTITRAPDWLQNGDVIKRRGKRYYVVSLHAPERRWQAWLRKIWNWVKIRNE